MEDFDEGKFVVTGPLWVAVDRHALGTDRDTRTTFIDDARGIQGGVANGRRYIVLFTDQDLAEKFVEWKDKLNLVARPLDHPLTLVHILENLQAAGYELVLFDVVKEGSRAQDVPIATLLEVLRRPPPTKDDAHEQL